MKHPVWHILACPRCGLEFRKRMESVDAQNRADAAERRSALAAVTIAQLREEVDRLRGEQANRYVPAVIDGTIINREGGSA